MKRILCGILVLSGTAFSAPTAAVNLRVMSFNVHHGNAGVTNLASFIAAQSPDVVGLQEVHSYHVSGYKSELERLTGRTWYTVWAPVGGSSSEGNLLLSRYPYLSSGYREIGPSSWGGNRTAARGEILVNGVAIQIFNTHLDWNPHGDTTNRTTNLTQLLEWSGTFPAPKMLIGDFNSNYWEWWITEIKKTYTDTYQDVTGSAAGPATHQNGWRPDYIFRSRASASSIVPTAAWVVSTTLSDHRPMMTDFSVAGAAPAQAPYGGSAVGLPGTVQAENFDTGGEGVAYHDTTAGNTGGAYRGENVDLEASSEGGANVGWIAAGEWLEYTVNVGSSGTYTIEARVACNGSGGAFRIEFGGVNKTGTLWIPNTGGWQAWQTVSVGGVSLSAGTQILRVVFEAAGSSGSVGNLNWVRVVAPASTQAPYGGTAVVLPGTVQAENFDTGGQNVAYYDATSDNRGGQYRPSEAVDIEACAEGGFNVGWNTAGEWLEYTVNVSAAGSYLLDVRVASNGSGGTFHIEFGGVNKTGTLTIPDTGGWQSWTTLTVADVSLSAGTQVMRIAMDTNGATGSVGNVNSVAVRGGTGLSGEYFDDTTLTAIRATRLDPTVNFDWALNAPHPNVGAETFSVRWTGRVVPRFTETYTFYTRTDDGVRLWLNGVLLIDDWTLHSATERSGMISLVAGRAYDLRMEYFDNLYNAVAQLSWSSPSQAKQIVPKERLFPPATAAARTLVADEAGAEAGGEGSHCGLLGWEILFLLGVMGAVQWMRSS
ncbi:MAG TPA: carbohydrate-binding protein [Planctomycetota bacterium]|nr:carbohydrate-binding protein [Planctomycetota bacterium]